MNVLSLYSSKTLVALADPGGVAPGARPPLTAADLWFFYAQNANFSQFFRRSLPSRLIFSLILIEIWPKHAKKCPSTFSMILYVNSWIRHWVVLLKQQYEYITCSCMCMCGVVFVCLNMLVKLIGYFLFWLFTLNYNVIGYFLIIVNPWCFFILFL